MSDNRNSPPVHIGEALQQYLEHSGAKRKVEAQQVILYWDEAVGPHLARSATPIKIADGMLTVKARNAIWRAELLMRRAEIATAINEYFHVEFVKTIVII